MIRIVGAGPGTAGYLTGEAARIIENSRVLVGGKRVLDELGAPADRRIELPDGMADAVIEALEREEAKGDVTLVVSGDPGFYSLAKRVTARFGRDRASVVPGISSVQIMAARLCRSWVGIASMTLHGRKRPDVSKLVDLVVNFPAVVVLFGAAEEVVPHVDWMASSAELASARAALGWDLGLPCERVIEADALSGLDAGSHTGRLALLWLEGRGGI
jgi:precorrin-6y C5,15-methyltransferase (decarboxylating) CbiE subunit